MARLNTNVEVIKDITQAGYIMDAAAGGNSTLSVAAAAGATTFTVASGTGFVAGDLFRLGSGNQLEEGIVDSIATNVITPRSPLAYAHAVGEACLERTKVPLGEVVQGSFKVTPNATYNQIKTDTTKGVYITLYTDAMFTVALAIINHSLENLAFAHGLGEGSTVITGTGTTNSPRRLVLTTQNLMALQNISIYCIGHRSDGVTQEQQIWNVDLTPGGDRTYGTGTGVPAPITAIGRANAILEYP